MSLGSSQSFLFVLGRTLVSAEQFPGSDVRWPWDGDSFAVLAGSGVTNTGPSVINGDLGTSLPTPAAVPALAAAPERNG